MESKEIMAEGKYVRLVRQGKWEFVERTSDRSAVVIVAVVGQHTAHKLVLVEQYRTAVDRRVIELPAGLVGDLAGQGDETLETAAGRELEEETGYSAESFERLTEGPPSAGLSSELVVFVRANGLKKISAGGGDGTENITVHEVALSGLTGWLQQREAKGLWVDPKVWAGAFFAAGGGAIAR